MLQTSKVRLTDFLDERSDYLTKFAEEANAEFDKVGEDAMKDLDEASSRVLYQFIKDPHFCLTFNLKLIDLLDDLA